MLGALRNLATAFERTGQTLGLIDYPCLTPENVVSYEGRIRLHPEDEFGAAWIGFDGRGDFAAYLYEQIMGSLEEGDRVDGNLYGRITVEVFPDPEMAGWPTNP